MKQITALSLLLLACSPLIAQKNTPELTLLQASLTEKATSQDHGTDVQLKNFTAISPALSTAQFGFFCRQELKWDKHTAIPVRFRLGSMEHCNRLEGKAH